MACSSSPVASGQADADADADRLAVDRDRVATPSGGCASRSAAGVALGEAGAEHRELVAAHPGHDVDIADDAADALGDAHQHPVARLVAEAVVDRLEVVEVDVEQRARAVVRADGVGEPGPVPRAR